MVVIAFRMSLSMTADESFMDIGKAHTQLQLRMYGALYLSSYRCIYIREHLQQSVCAKYAL